MKAQLDVHDAAASFYVNFVSKLESCSDLILIHMEGHGILSNPDSHVNMIPLEFYILL
jgi:hypothetical protein